MQTLKSVYGVARAVLPIGYCGYLLYYFLDVGGSVEEAWDIGLGPTLLGLGVIALLFGVPLYFKIKRLFRDLHLPWPGAPTDHGDDDANDDDANDDAGAAADAAIARYLGRKAQEEAAAARPAPQRGGPPARPSFGRKSG